MIRTEPQRRLRSKLWFSSIMFLQEVGDSISVLRGPVEAALARTEEVVAGARPLEAQRIREMSGLLSSNWDKVLKQHQDRVR